MADKGITVSVDNGVLTVCPDPVAVGSEKNRKLVWAIDGDTQDQGWKFPSDGTGIAITNPGGQFDPPDPGNPNNDKKFTWKAKNGNRLSYKYTINLVNGTQKKSLDPTIQNGGDGK